MRGKRKGRGGRRGFTASGDLPSDSPKRKDSRIEFHGHLSHASPPITSFFQPQSKEQSCSSSEKTNELAISCTGKHSDNETSEKILPILEEEASTPIEVEIPEGLVQNDITSDGEEKERAQDLRSESPSLATPHKIVLDGTDAALTALTPSNVSALSELTLANGETALKKTTKSRRKLNPNQTANQLAQASAGAKPNCCTKLKAPSDTITSSVTTTSNGSQHKLTEYFPVRRSVRKTKKTVMEERQRTLEEAVIMCKEEGLQVHHFEGKGRGIVARRHFAKGEFVVEYAGELIKMDDARQREKSYAQDQNTGCYMYYFKHRNQQYCVDATPESDRLGRLVNHSRNGNLLTKTITVDNIPRLVLIAKEDIQPGEEVTYDYGDRSKESLKYHPWLAC